MVYQKLFKVRKDKKIQYWFMETHKTVDMETCKRTVSGQLDNDGHEIPTSEVCSEWKVVFPTNIGKKNYRNAVTQADFEVKAEYDIRLKEGYATSLDELKSVIFKEPMLAKVYDEKDIKKYTQKLFSQPKLDGIRCILSKKGMFSRKGREIISAPHIYENMKVFLDQGYVFDGELYNHSLKNDFNTIISLTRKTKPTNEDLILSKKSIQYWIFDIINTERRFDSRIYELYNIEKKLNSLYCCITPTQEILTKNHLDDLYTQYLSDGFEGQMIRLNDYYIHGRTKSLLKRKTFQDKEFKIVKIEEGTGNWQGLAKRVFCTDENIEFVATLKNDMTLCKIVLQEAAEYVNGEATVRFQNLTPDGIPRFPVAVAIFKKERDM